MGNAWTMAPEEVQRLFRKVMALSRMEVDKDGDPVVRVESIDWIDSCPSLGLGQRGEIEVVWPEGEGWLGGYVNGRWAGKRAMSRVICRISKEGDLEDCDDDGDEDGPNIALRQFSSCIFSAIYLNDIGEEAEEVLNILDEAPENWEEQILLRHICEARIQKYGAMNEEEIKEKVEEEARLIAERIWESVIIGTSTVSHQDIVDSIQNDVLMVDDGETWVEIHSSIQKNGIPDEFDILEEGGLHDLMYGRGKVKNEEEVLPILKRIDPDKYPEEELFLGNIQYKNGWTYVRIIRGG